MPPPAIASPMPLDCCGARGACQQSPILHSSGSSVPATTARAKGQTKDVLHVIGPKRKMPGVWGLSPQERQKGKKSCRKTKEKPCGTPMHRVLHFATLRFEPVPFGKLRALSVAEGMTCRARINENSYHSARPNTACTEAVGPMRRPHVPALTRSWDRGEPRGCGRGRAAGGWPPRRPRRGRRRGPRSGCVRARRRYWPGCRRWR